MGAPAAPADAERIQVEVSDLQRHKELVMVGRCAHPTGRLVVPLVTAAVLLGACSQGDGSNGLAHLATGGGGAGAAGDRPGQAPPAPQDVGQAFDDAIEATRGVESTELQIFMQVGTDSLGIEGELSASGVGHVTAAGSQGADLELRTDGETAWLRADDWQVTHELPDGARWVAAPHDELVDVGVMQELDETWGVLPVLRGIESVEDLGVEEVEGVPVRMLRGDVDYQAALDAASIEERQDLEDAISIDGEIEELVAEVGLDGDGRVRSLDLETELGGDVGPGLLMTIDFEVHAFNQAVEAPDAPSSDETVPLDDVPGLAESLAEGL